MSETVRTAEVEGIDRAVQRSTELFTRFLMNARAARQPAAAPAPAPAPAQPASPPS
jgi:hypothetical protein